MADPIVRSPADSFQSILMPERGNVDDDRSMDRLNQQRNEAVFFQALPCVLYWCDLSFEIMHVSPNSRDLLQLEAASVVGTRAFCRDRVFRGDIEYLEEQFRALKASGSISLIHRMRDKAGLPFWVVHSLRRTSAAKDPLLLGCIVPVRDERRLEDLDRHTVSRFIHKLGNHLQLLTLLGSSLGKQLPDSRDSEVLQETVGKLIELTRALSDYTQEPSWLSAVDCEEFLNGVINAKKSALIGKEISLHVKVGKSVRGTAIRGDANLLEAALGSVVQNALEATESGGRVSLTATTHQTAGKPPSVLEIRVTDSGCGIPPADLNKVVAPFFTTKKNHDGLGLSLATRFIEMHGGALTVQSQPSGGVEVAIILPAGLAKASLDP